MVFFFFFTPFTFKLYLKQIEKTTEDRGRVNLYKVTILVNQHLDQEVGPRQPLCALS